MDVGSLAPGFESIVSLKSLTSQMNVSVIDMAPTLDAHSLNRGAIPKRNLQMVPYVMGNIFEINHWTKNMKKSLGTSKSCSLKAPLSDTEPGLDVAQEFVTGLSLELNIFFSFSHQTSL